MSSVRLNSKDIEALHNWNECFAFIVHNKSHYWVLDWEAHFNLNHKLNMEASFRKGSITETQFKTALDQFRGGVPQLDEITFIDYLASVKPKIFTAEDLRTFFFTPKFSLEEISKPLFDFLTFGYELSLEHRKKCEWVRAMLPKFYINFDRKIFLHMFDGRMHEKVINQGWYGAFCDFEHMIPCAERYWCRSLDEDFWAVTNLSS